MVIRTLEGLTPMQAPIQPQDNKFAVPATFVVFGDDQFRATGC